ncbi:MAG: hypothetical protein U5K71_02105 [Gracilimonas sp.]|nr:hypothetical protein [Gracilimonas sp.]
MNSLKWMQKNALIKAEWIRSKLDLGEPELVFEHFIDSDSLLNLKVLQADVLFQLKGYKKATKYLNKFSEDISNSPAQNFKFTLELRKDSTQWDFLLDQRYSDRLVGVNNYLEMNTPNQMLSLSKALELKNYEKVLNYLSLLPDEAFTNDWFDIIEEAIHQTAFNSEYSIAKDLINKISDLDLRSRYKERLSEQSEWLSFLQSKNYIP